MPIISADDDCIYVCNYAEELYNKWSDNKDYPVIYRKSMFEYCLCGPATIYPPQYYDGLLDDFRCNYSKHGMNDDGLAMNFFKNKRIHPIHISDKFPCYFHDEISPITGSCNNKSWRDSQRFE